MNLTTTSSGAIHMVAVTDAPARVDAPDGKTKLWVQDRNGAIRLGPWRYLDDDLREWTGKVAHVYAWTGGADGRKITVATRAEVDAANRMRARICIPMPGASEDVTHALRSCVMAMCLAEAIERRADPDDPDNSDVNYRVAIVDTVAVELSDAVGLDVLGHIALETAVADAADAALRNDK